MKTCIDCKVEKDESMFRTGRNGCKECAKKKRIETNAKKKVNRDLTAEKICTLCKEKKIEKDFNFGSAWCRKCTALKKKQRLEKAKKELPKEKTCRTCNKTKKSDRFRLGENVCKDCSTERLYNWRSNNKEAFKKICETYRNKDDYREKQNKYKRDKYNSCDNYKHSHRYRLALREYVFRGKILKKFDTIVGMKREQLRDWIEFNFKPGMTWDNYNEVWNLDHVKPCSSFDLTQKEELKKCFSWKNTTPIYFKENMEKFNKNDEDLIKYIEGRTELFLSDKTQKAFKKLRKKREAEKLEEKLND